MSEVVMMGEVTYLTPRGSPSTSPALPAQSTVLGRVLGVAAGPVPPPSRRSAGAVGAAVPAWGRMGERNVVRALLVGAVWGNSISIGEGPSQRGEEWW